MKIYLKFASYSNRVYDLIHSLNLQHDNNCTLALLIKSNSLELYDRLNPKQKSIKVDFVSKKNCYRCFKNIKKNEILSKVVGIKKFYFPLVLDLTAGLGNDAFILSFLGCQVIMIERNLIAAALLIDGLQRGYKDKKIGYWLKKRLHLIVEDSFNILKIPYLKPDVIYLDPMYPFHKKKSLPKKICNFLDN